MNSSSQQLIRPVSEPATHAGDTAQRRMTDWRIAMGLVLSFTWLLLAALYIRDEVGWSQFSHLRPDSLGQFLDGAFAPLAFLWLVIGYFLQQKEISDNTAALHAQSEQIQLSARQAVRQSELIAQNEVHARQETFLRIAGHVRMQLGTIMGMLWVSSQGAVRGSAGDGLVSGIEQSNMWAQMSQNDSELFSRTMIATHLRAEGDGFALFYGTPVRARHSNHFIVTFEHLIARAEECDPDGMIVSSLRYNAHGLIYKVAKQYQSIAPPELADPERTGLYIQMNQIPA